MKLVLRAMKMSISNITLTNILFLGSWLILHFFLLILLYLLLISHFHPRVRVFYFPFMSMILLYLGDRYFFFSFYLKEFEAINFQLPKPH